MPYKVGNYHNREWGIKYKFKLKGARTPDWSLVPKGCCMHSVKRYAKWCHQITHIPIVFILRRDPVDIFSHRRMRADPQNVLHRNADCVNEFSQ